MRRMSLGAFLGLAVLLIAMSRYEKSPPCGASGEDPLFRNDRDTDGP